MGFGWDIFGFFILIVQYFLKIILYVCGIYLVVEVRYE